MLRRRVKRCREGASIVSNSNAMSLGVRSGDFSSGNEDAAEGSRDLGGIGIEVGAYLELIDRRYDYARKYLQLTTVVGLIALISFYALC